jgi:hypothetical protein
MSTKIAAVFAFAALLLPVALLAQDPMLKVKGGHQLGETAEQFFSEGFEKQALDACATGNYKDVNKSSRREMKGFCGQIADAQQKARTEKHYEYKGGGDITERRTDTFTFDAGRLVKVELVFLAPGAEVNYRGQSFDQILAGLKQAYGPPTKETTEPFTSTYGIQYVAHRELWLGPRAVILATEVPGESGSTTLSAFTRAQYDRTMEGSVPKPSNPLQ